MAKILAIDPGPEKSAWLRFDPFLEKPCIAFGIAANRSILSICREAIRPTVTVIEMVACYGMPVGKDIFNTVLWIGGFKEATKQEAILLFRKDIKMHLCQSCRAKDSNIRQALIDRFGPGREKAVGTKKQPGPLYGIKKDLWSALAIAVTYCDLNLKGERK